MDIAILSYVIRVIITSGVFSYYAIGSLQSRCRYNKFQTNIFIFLHCVITTLITVCFFMPGGVFSPYYTIGIVLWIIWAVWVLHKVIRGSYLEVLFIILVTLNLYVNIVTLAKMGLDIIGIGYLHDAVYAAAVLLITILYLPALWYLYIRLYKKVIEFDIQLSFWRFIWVVPAMTYMIFYVKIVKDYWMSHYVASTGDMVFGILWSFCTYMFFLVSLEMLVQTHKGALAQEETHMIASQLQMQKGQYEQLLDNMEKTARLQHDWRHHLRTLNGFAEKNDLESLQGYLKDLLPGYMFEDSRRVCDNSVADAILQYYVSIAPKKGINLDLNIDIPRRITVADTDLCIIIGNLVENAMEACSAIELGEKYIKVRGGQAGKQLGIVISNTYNGKINHDETSYLSTKREGAGIGLSSVKRVVEKYNGIMEINYDEAYFSVNILIRIG